MLSDILGIMIAFVSVILLLSILVTALVQFIQAALHLRARNLRKGLAELILVTEQTAAGNDEKKTGKDISVKDCMERANTVLDDPSIALIARARLPMKTEKANVLQKAFQSLGGPRVVRALMGPPVSWVDSDRLKDVAKKVMDGPAGEEGEKKESEEINREQQKSEKAEALASAFKDAQPLLQRRFQFQIRLLTFGIAFAVAFAFQVSAPRLLLDLTHDAERRNAIVAGADKLLVSAAEDIRRLDYEDAAIEALQVLQVRYRDQRHLIGLASGVGTTQRAIVEELSLALEGSPQKAEILAEYETLLEDLAQERLGTAREIAINARIQLKEYGVFLWPQAWGFYFENAVIAFKTLKIDAVIGVLITGILLSLGAPVWFEMLRNIVRLRDVLSGKAGTSSKPPDEGDTSKTDEKDDSDEGGNKDR